MSPFLLPSIYLIDLFIALVSVVYSGIVDVRDVADLNVRSIELGTEHSVHTMQQCSPDEAAWDFLSIGRKTTARRRPGNERKAAFRVEHRSNCETGSAS